MIYISDTIDQYHIILWQIIILLCINNQPNKCKYERAFIDSVFSADTVCRFAT
jgi:hypothetical protein